jgi:hypothetical protein
MKTRKFVNTGCLTTLRHLLYWFGTPCLMFAAMLALAGTASAQVPFAAISAKGGVSVDDPGSPSMLRFDLKSSFSLGLKSDGLNPLAEDLTLDLTYAGYIDPELAPAGSVDPELNVRVFVPARCLTQAGSIFKMQDYHNCGVSIRLVNGPQAPNEILPFIELVPAVNKFDLRLMPSPNGQWDLKVSIDFFASTPNGPIAGIIAILRAPSAIKLSIGSDAGEVLMRRIEFGGALPVDQG